MQSYLPLTTLASDPTTYTDQKLSPADLIKACEKHQYTTEIISLDPLLIYINNFTSAQEAEGLINIGYASTSLSALEVRPLTPEPAHQSFHPHSSAAPEAAHSS
jgi:hypothetical protein